ncbi:rho GTPase-activating protein SYDE1 isoform X2 [Syngnathus typhle]|uniref:rho GTPase-activating protein SYDE1 isoform X2 n=1 Tax=Syngnathus typhle TaxID=161592 RepID=UPI002A6AF24A|nr:rho GTPase-activating protein SYDE1 isoform X2 [Syngnathus typhle]
MAQPLLKRTFSRLRGKNRSRRKTEPQVNDATAQPHVTPRNSGASGAAAAGPRSPPLGRLAVPWARRGAAPVCAKSECAQDKPAGGATTHPKTTAAVAANELPGRRAYLQSLERSSRDWVLSSAPDEAGGSQSATTDIWYNPIPEEERARLETTGNPAQGGKEALSAAAGAVGCSSSESAGKDWPSVKSFHVGHRIDRAAVAPGSSEGADPRPALPRKGGVMDRLMSPGAVRKLSLKMRKLPELRRKISLRSSRVGQGGGDGNASDVLSRYHLDSSAPPAARSATKGGYLSDGDSPEASPRQPSHPASFRHVVSGMLSVHLLALDLERTKTNEWDESREIFLAIQIDGMARARTSLLRPRGHSVPLDHTFRLELERARRLGVAVLSPAARFDRAARPGNVVCCLGGVALPPLFKGSGARQLSVKLEPQGRLDIKVSLQERRDAQGAANPSGPAHVFGVELRRLLEEERSVGGVPLLVQKTVAEIERRGLKTVGLYRLCGSAAVKKQLRDGFERDGSAVRLGEDLYPDVNVLTGILKDFLRELPSSLITAALYEAVREAMTRRPAPPPSPDVRWATVELLSCLPVPERVRRLGQGRQAGLGQGRLGRTRPPLPAERWPPSLLLQATLTLLLDHLSLVAHFSPRNRMTHRNLAVCFGPVLLKRAAEAKGGPGGGEASGDSARAVDFKLHIEALHYLLRLWPVPTHRIPAGADDDDICPAPRPKPTCQRPDGGALEAVWRRGRGTVARLDSPPPANRYAGDWSGQRLAPGRDVEYDEVARSESDPGGEDDDDDDDDEEEEDGGEPWRSGARRAPRCCAEDLLDFDAPFNCRLSLKDFDGLINDLDRELAKRVNICT